MNRPVFLVKNDVSIIDPLIDIHNKLSYENKWEMRQRISGSDTNTLRRSHGLQGRDIADLTISKIPMKYYEQIFNFIPEEILSAGRPRTMTFFVSISGREISPHVDRLRRTALNIYLSNVNSKTVFYHELKPVMSSELVKYDNREKPGRQSWYPNENELIVDHVYTPHRGDIAILNVSKPHSVKDIKSSVPRIMLSIDLPKQFCEYIM